MRAIAFVGLLLLLPVAAADQHVGANGSYVQTTNADTGDCSNSGSQWHAATLFVANPLGSGGETLTVFSTCNAYNGTYGNEHYWGESRSTGVTFQDQRFGTSGPGFGYVWYGGSNHAAGGYTYDNSYCGSTGWVGGTYEGLGCPMPTGDEPPMLPVLP